MPSQRTLRDHTHHIKAAPGFSHDVDVLLSRAAKVESCSERDKYTLLLLDEMHIREDIVYDKHSGEMIGFTNLGEITEHLLVFEKQICGDQPHLAKTMMVFNSLQFAYAQFPCAELTGELSFLGSRDEN